MKKILLLVTPMLLSAAQAFATEEVFEAVYFTSVSPNGEWVAGSIDEGSVMIRNILTGDYKTYFTNGVSTNYYIGNGATPVSDTGIVVGSTTGDDAAYWENGKWTTLKVANPQFSNSAKSITPDGSTICGLVGMDEISLDAEKIMGVPAVWYRQTDGSYSDPVLLPHPEYDFTGRVPQYVTATAISADGTIIAGQIRDYTGMMHEPIIFTRSTDGEWSYKLLYPELINPSGMDFPAYPGEYEGPEMPSQEQFMSEEELAAFQAALEAGENPDYEDFMTATEIDSYMVAFMEWMAVYAPWQEKYEAFVEAYSRNLDDGYSFVFNNVALTPDGRYFATTRVVTVVVDPTLGLEGIKDMTYPVILNVDGSGYKDLDSSLEEMSLLMSSMTQDGSVLATYMMYPEGAVTRAYIFPEMATTAVPLEEYIATRNATLAGWMEENMYHDVIVGVTPAGKFIYDGFMCSGAPIATPDMSTILCYTTTEYWDTQAGDPYFLSYYFNTGFNVDPVLVEGIQNDSDSVFNILPGGSIYVKGAIAEISVYDITGARVFMASTPSGTIETGLPAGVYVVMATAEDGTAISKKALF